jgi:hypothetical protein
MDAPSDAPATADAAPKPPRRWRALLKRYLPPAIGLVAVVVIL